MVVFRPDTDICSCEGVRWRDYAKGPRGDYHPRCQRCGKAIVKGRDDSWRYFAADTSAKCRCPSPLYPAKEEYHATWCPAYCRAWTQFLKEGKPGDVFVNGSTRIRIVDRWGEKGEWVSYRVEGTIDHHVHLHFGNGVGTYSVKVEV